MFSFKIMGVTVMASLISVGGWAGGCHVASPMTENIPTADSSDLKTVAEGSVSPITTTFVGVFRDAETYSNLHGLARDLPDLKADFFKSNLVIAVFLGERTTAGYSVAITLEPSGQVRISEKAPRKDAMVAQVITSPFKLVSIATNGAPAVQLSLDEGFRQSGTLYQIKSGSFSISGGVAGRKEAFQLQGKLQVSRLYPLITIGFAVVSADAPRARSLRDTATGLLTDNTIAIQRLSRGSLLDSPAGELQVRGSLAEKRKLRLELNSGPVTVPDGFSGQGTIEGEQLVTSVRQ